MTIWSAVRRVGGKTLISVDVQVVAASNRNLKEMIAKYRSMEGILPAHLRASSKSTQG